MARRSKGLKCKGRKKFTKHPRERGLTSVVRATQELLEGTKVAIVIDPGARHGQPHHRYQGRVAVVQGKIGRVYRVEIRDGGKTKSLICGPEHLRLVR